MMLMGTLHLPTPTGKALDSTATEAGHHWVRKALDHVLDNFERSDMTGLP
jgi:hypothetical protein